MKKNAFLGLLLIISIMFIVNLKIKNYYGENNNIIGIYVDNELQESIPKKGEVMFSKAICDNDNINYYWDVDNWGLFVDNLNKKTKCNLYFVNYSGQTVFDFDYTGAEQTFTVPVSGTYRLETWGAQGGTFQILETILSGGYGGYSSGNISLEKENKLYITVGSQGTAGNSYQTATQYIGYGGYNGGGNGGLGLLESEGKYFSSGTGGGGATSIQNILINNGLLKEYKDNITNVILVSRGGGGNGVHSSVGHGGGISGTSSSSRNREYFVEGATQTTGYEFGIGQDAINQKIYNSVGAEGRGGGGGGFYGGLTYTGDEHDYDDASGSGGSGYIGNPLLTNKVMYCYNCEESSEESTKTISTTCNEETPTTNCAKRGNGYARITLVSIDE